MRQVIRVFSVLALLVAASVVHAQSSSRPLQVAATTDLFTRGSWYGIIKDYPFDDSPLRTLNVAVVGNQLVCTWDQPGKATGRPACSVQDNTLTLTTGPGSSVTLHLEGEGLKGTFTPKGQGSYSLAMGRQPIVPAAESEDSTPQPKWVSCKQDRPGAATINLSMADPSAGTVRVDIETNPMVGGYYQNNPGVYKNGRLTFGYKWASFDVEVRKDALVGTVIAYWADKPPYHPQQAVWHCKGNPLRLIRGH